MSSNRKTSVWRPGSLHAGHRYSFDVLALPVWLAYAALNVFMMYTNYTFLTQYVGESLKKCFEESYCFAVIELVNRNLGPLSMLLCIALYGRRQKAASLAGTERTIAFLRRAEDADRDHGTATVGLSPVFRYWSAAVIAAYWVCLGMYTAVQSPLEVAMFTFNAMPQIAVINLIVFQYYVLERGYARVNRLLESADFRAGRRGAAAARTLARLADAYDELGRLVDLTNNAYLPSQLVRLPYSMVRLVMVVFRIIELMADVHMDQPVPRVIVFLIVEHVGEVLMFLLQLLSFCAVGARLAQQSERTSASLQNLKLSNRINLDQETRKTINNFWIRVNARKVKATIGGFFIINMDMMKAVCGIIVTYFLVLIQFKIQKDDSKAKPMIPIKN